MQVARHVKTVNVAGGGGGGGGGGHKDPELTFIRRNVSSDLYNHTDTCLQWVMYVYGFIHICAKL